MKPPYPPTHIHVLTYAHKNSLLRRPKAAPALDRRSRPEQPLPMDDSNVIRVSRRGYVLSAELQQLVSRGKTYTLALLLSCNTASLLSFCWQSFRNPTQALTYHELLGHTVIHGVARGSSLHKRVCLECIIERVRAALLPLSLAVRPTQACSRCQKRKKENVLVCLQHNIASKSFIYTTSVQYMHCTHEVH